ncbi:MAG TPA: septum formation initiator family protein [Sedimentibacter sp.]|nr:septum formation initiator family protein [Sedimentibacter sp.]HNZ83464.1 septum formation initiator family protein [Sedimentibacter sp.]HOH70234.1 septum formation initiator family protein [Sedimentibacter sp.]HPX00181.1 septum formation initiator family protein [Sedimentibacter sp.]HQB63611.1 septum formation initiator family protein [Sedimentibacter sp.]
MNEEQRIIELKKKINHYDFREKEREIKEQKRIQKMTAPIKKKRKFNVINFLFLVFVMYFAYTAFNQYEMLADLNGQIEEKEMIKAETEREAFELKSDVEKLSQEEALMEIVEKIARDQYKMVKPNETIYIDKNKNDNKLIQGIGSEKDLINE